MDKTQPAPQSFPAQLTPQIAHNAVSAVTELYAAAMADLHGRLTLAQMRITELDRQVLLLAAELVRAKPPTVPERPGGPSDGVFDPVTSSVRRVPRVVQPTQAPAADHFDGVAVSDKG